VAERAGVSEATVSRVFNNVAPLKEQTRKKVLLAAQELNYQPNELARSFAKKRSGNIGVVLPFLPGVHLFSTYYFSEILSGIGNKVREHGYDLLLKYRSPDEKPDLISLYRSRKVDACIILGMRDVPEEEGALVELEEEGLPFCLVNQSYPGRDFNVVDADHSGGSFEVIGHFLEQGLTRIALINGPQHFSNSRDRLRGVVNALRDAGMEGLGDSLYFEGNYSRKSGFLLAERIAQTIRKESVQAVFAANDRMAIGLMQGLKELGILAGRDYFIAGYDDSDAARWLEPPLTSVKVPFYEMGETAADQLLQLLEGAREEAAEKIHIKMGTELVVRASTLQI
jgi:DNA-binding LacI/PurR family transcriptional regulator